MASHKHPVLRLALLTTLAALAGCGVTKHLPGFGGDDNTSLGQADIAPSIFGYVVADEPQAALAARQILNNGGNAADAAAAAGFAMAVTLPSRAGLGGGGACIIKMPAADGTAQPPVTLLFPAGAPAQAGGDRPAAVPALARGLLALQAHYGALPFASVIAPAERLAGGSPVSPALAADLQVVGAALASSAHPVAVC
jgi:gamma-glutamyltranspeptidase/glutathione hydrolase